MRVPRSKHQNPAGKEVCSTIPGGFTEATWRLFTWRYDIPPEPATQTLTQSHVGLV